ncbi:MAG: hypothetical protein ACI9WC_001759 [Arenicella sp.]|jgi:hypothetical protein
MKVMFSRLILLIGLTVSAQAQSQVVVIPLGDGGPDADVYLATVLSDGSTISKTSRVISSAPTGIIGS